MGQQSLDQTLDDAIRPMARPELLQSVKDAVLSTDGGSHATLTSEKAKAKSAVHGMGGVGKTTAAVALVNDKEVRAAFERVLWVSVGQEPNVRELQASLLAQINERTLSVELANDKVLGEIKKASKGLKILLVLDDVWEAKYVDGIATCAPLAPLPPLTACQ